MSILALVKLSRNIKQVWVFIFSHQDLTFVFFELSITSSAWKWKCKSTSVVVDLIQCFFLTWNQKLAWKPFLPYFCFFFTEQNRFSLHLFTTFLGFCTTIFIFHALYIIFSRVKSKLFTLNNDSGNFLVLLFFTSSLSFFKLDRRVRGDIK